MKVYKYTLPFTCANRLITVAMAPGACVVSVLTDTSGIHLYAEVSGDSSGLSPHRYFFAAWTGYELPDGPKEFIGTVRNESGLVYHIYEVLPYASNPTELPPRNEPAKKAARRIARRTPQQ